MVVREFRVGKRLNLERQPEAMGGAGELGDKGAKEGVLSARPELGEMKNSVSSTSRRVAV